MIRLRRMYARLLFVVVGIFRVVLARFTPPKPVFGRCALALTGAGDIRWRMNEAIRPGQGTQAVATPEVSVVVPTFNERDNVTALFRKLEVALAGLAWEVIYVDDNSPDGTWDVVRALARED